LKFIHDWHSLEKGSAVVNASDEDWELLLSLFPMGWQEQAVLSGAVERLRGFESAANLLRVLLLHVGRGYSLRETAVRAKLAGWTEVSDVALLKRLRKARNWLRQMCVALLREGGWHMEWDTRGWNLRVLDGTVINELGRGGGRFRIHYSLQLPSLECDHLEITPLKGAGQGEKLHRFPAAPGDLILADGGFCKAVAVHAISTQQAAVIVRLNATSMPLFTRRGKPFPLMEHLRRLDKPGHPREWPVWIRSKGENLPGRLCAVRKAETVIEQHRRRLRRRAQRKGSQLKPETLERVAYVVVFTTLPAEEFSLRQVLQCYRLRWQIELVFKRLKSLARVGHLPKHEELSAQAWLYGKLLIVLMGQKLMRMGRDISPWGYELDSFESAERLARV
jgi:hypothetical protein